MEYLSTKLGEIAAFRSDGETPLLVFIPGIQGSKELFLPLLNEAYIQPYATLAIDLPGFGNSVKPVEFDYTVSSFANLVHELIPHDSDVVLIGHSLGGMIATKLLDSKLKIKGLISLEGNLRLADCGATKDIAVISKEAFIGSYYPGLLEKLSLCSEPSAAFRLAALKKADPQALYETSCAIVAESDSERLVELLSKADCPSLLLVGSNSSFASRSTHGRGETLEIQNAGHFLIHDNYFAVATAIRTFLSRL